MAPSVTDEHIVSVQVEFIQILFCIFFSVLSQETSRV